MADRTYPVVLADGHRFLMGPLTGREIINMKTGKLSEDQVLELVASRVIEHDYDVADPLDLDVRVLLDVVTGWSAAIRDAALPPVTGGR